MGNLMPGGVDHVPFGCNDGIWNRDEDEQWKIVSHQTSIIVDP